MLTALIPAFALLACQSSPVAASGTTGTSPAPAPAETHTIEAPQTGGAEGGQTGGSTGSQSGAQSGEQQSQDKHRHVPQRMYQLDDLERVKLKIGEHEFNAWVMDTYLKRMEGMMFLENSDFKDNDAMIFVFKEAEPQRFWMKNTLVPLDIAYCSADKKILNTYTMKALDIDTDYSSAGPSKYVIEFRAGIFKKLEIKAGMKVEIPDKVKAKD